jgi:hypothetical protein
MNYSYNKCKLVTYASANRTCHVVAGGKVGTVWH